ncbi:hypothetical protein DIE07_10985 [Burkholderia sp. Bp9002]|nr:hypothetical protein DIE07_10985 [Burkholderia sp. Bp9002]
MDNTLKLRVMVDMVDNMTKPLQMILTGNKGLADSLKASRRELDEMAKTQQRVGEFREMRRGLADTALQLEAVRAQVDALGQSLNASGPPSRQMIQDFEEAKDASSGLADTFGEQADQLRELRSQLADASAETNNLAKHQRELRASTESSGSRIAPQTQEFDDDRHAQREARREAAAKIAERGKALKDTGVSMVEMLSDPVGDAKQAEIATLRLRLAGASANAAAFARSMHVYGQSAIDNLSLMAEAMETLDDEQQAMLAVPTLSKVQFSNAVLLEEKDAKARDEKFMKIQKVIAQRGGLANPAAYDDEANTALRMLAVTEGRVNADEWSTFAKEGGDAAKQLRKDAFYYQMEPIVKALGGKDAGKGLASIYGSVFQGKMNASVAQQLKSFDLLDPKQLGMLKDSPFEWLEKVVLPRLAAKGITSPEKIKAVLTTLLGNQDAGKLLNSIYDHLREIRETAEDGAKAPGIDAMQAIASQSTHGRELNAKAQGHNLILELGEKVLPTYNAALDITAGTTERIVGLVKEHSGAAMILATAFVLLGGALAIAGTLMNVFGIALGAAGISAFASTAVSAIGFIGDALVGLVGLVIANPLMAGVLALVVGGGAVGAYAWNNPDALGGFGGWLKNLFGKEDSDAAGGQGRVSRTAATIATAATLVGPPVYAANPPVASAALLAPYTQSLDYRQGLAAQGFAANASIAGATPISRINTPFVMPAAAASAVPPPSPAPITINITPPPGVNAAELARVVRIELERAERAKAARVGSRLSD